MRRNDISGIPGGRFVYVRVIFFLPGINIVFPIRYLWKCIGASREKVRLKFLAWRDIGVNLSEIWGAEILGKCIERKSINGSEGFAPQRGPGAKRVVGKQGLCSAEAEDFCPAVCILVNFGVYSSARSKL